MKRLLLTALTVLPLGAVAQEARQSSSIFLTIDAQPDVVMPFDIKAEGRRFNPTWGLDQAWINEQNMRKGINHMGKDNIGVARSAFRMTQPLVGDTAVTTEQISYMQQRNTSINLVSFTLPIILTADQEAGSVSYYVENKSAKTDRWSAMINAHVAWLQKNTRHTVMGVSPFNEPDYWTTEEGATTAKQREVARILKTSYPRFEGVAIVGGNTLNNDKAMTWYTTGKEFYDWGNTHQLAGSMANYAAFYRQVVADGKVAYNDEMHNVTEAMTGLENGMTVGIWWGFDSRARGEFCQFSRHGERLSYAEHQPNWTSAAVYRHDDGRVKAFIGSSERQALTTTWQLLSPDRELYFDGHGPTRSFEMQMPGGTAYQKGQTNAERVIDITWGEDVPQAPIDGLYKIVNKATGTVVASTGTNIVMQKDTRQKAQQWNIHPCDPRIGGDYSFYDIELSSNSRLRMNVLNFSTLDGANVIAYNQNATPSSNEQWYLEYAGQGYYYIRNRETALYLTSASDRPYNNVNVQTNVFQSGSAIDRQMWRLLPPDVDYETAAPDAPQALVATAHNASVALSWQAPDSADVATYTVLRAARADGQWNTIARGLTACRYTDNTCTQGTDYVYKVKAVDTAGNTSEPSDVVASGPTGTHGLMARWQMDCDLLDSSPNMMDAVATTEPTPEFDEDHSSGTHSVRFDGRGAHLRLPCAVAATDQISVCMWVYMWSTSAWQRLFDFGNGTDSYMFLTPSDGSHLRFAIKNGGPEQTLDCPTRLPALRWKHVTLTLADGVGTIYVDGVAQATATGFTLRPSDLHATRCYIGRSQFAADPLLNACIDDVRIYNHALTPQQVAQVMADTAPDAVATPVIEPQPAATYTVGGRHATSAHRGITISQGRKHVEK